MPLLQKVIFYKMSSDENALLTRMMERIHDPKRFVDLPDVINKRHELHPPVSPSELDGSERRLGFRLPGLLSRLYLEVGNGGFGPGYGLLALNEHGARNYHLNLVDQYLTMINNAPPDYPPWPQRFLTVCDWGDGITSVLDASDSAAPILRFRGDQYDGGPWESVMTAEAPTLYNWLEDWLDDQPLFKRVQS